VANIADVFPYKDADTNKELFCMWWKSKSDSRWGNEL